MSAVRRFLRATWVASLVLLPGATVAAVAAVAGPAAASNGTSTTAPHRAQVVTTPLYRMWNPTITDHFYTTSQAEVLTAINGGWRSEGITGYCW